MPAHATSLTGSFSGNAYASYANLKVGPLAAGLGESAFIPCPCAGTNGKAQSNNIASLSVGTGGSVLKLGAAVSTTISAKTSSSAYVTDTSQITGVRLLGGLITADALTAVANVSATSSAIATSPAGSGFVNLKVAGHAIAANVAANTVLSLPGIGTVTLEKTVASSGSTSGSMEVEMLSVSVTSANSFGLPTGVTLVVGHALSGFTRVQPLAALGGQAWGASANAAIGGALQSKIGQVAYVTVPCLGTKYKILTNNVSSTSVSGLVSLGTSATTAFGGTTQDGYPLARTSATVSNINLLGGLIGASTITSVAQETLVKGVRVRSTAGTSFAGLTIGHLAVPVNVPANTTIELPLLGYVIVNEQIIPTSGSKTQVNGLHIVVTTTNLLGLPVGTEILIAHAHAYTQPF